MSKKTSVEKVTSAKVAGASEAEALQMAHALFVLSEEPECSPEVKAQCGQFARTLKGNASNATAREELMGKSVFLANRA